MTIDESRRTIIDHTGREWEMEPYRCQRCGDEVEIIATRNGFCLTCDTELLLEGQSVASYGPHTWEVCSACNYNAHRCPGCGTDLTHAEAGRGGHCQ